MKSTFTFPQFLTRFPDDDACLEEIKKLRFRDGVFCTTCKKITEHYKLKKRRAYSCEYCRHQVFPLTKTIFEKSSTPLRLWFYALFLMTHTKAGISVKQLQRELGVTYKTAWRIYNLLYKLMKHNNADLLSGTIEVDEAYIGERGKERVYRWTLFNRLEIRVVQRKDIQEENQ